MNNNKALLTLTLAGLLSISAIPAFAKVKTLNLGTHGQVYEITENDFEEWLMARLQSKEVQKNLTNFTQEQVQRMAERHFKVTDFYIPEVREYRKRTIDPTITIKHDVKDHMGNILYRKGTKVNPFQYTSFSRAYLFINASDTSHINLYKKLAAENKILIQTFAVKGDIRDFNESVKNAPPAGRPTKQILDRFAIEKLPSFAWQSEKYLIVEELLPVKSSSKGKKK